MSDEVTANATRNTWIAFGMLSLAIVGGMYNLTIAPIDNKVDQLTMEVRENQTKTAQTAVHIEYMSDALKRIEAKLEENKQ